MNQNSVFANESIGRKPLLEVAMANLAPLLDPPALSDVEKELMSKVESGDFLIRGNEGDGPGQASTWGPDRVIRAKVLEWICTDRVAREYITHKGVLIIGARIEALVTLAYAQMPFPFWLRRCSITEGIILPGAEIKALHLDGSITGPILADYAKFTDSVQMRNGFEARGEVRLLGAKIGGDLDCGTARFVNSGAVALDGNGIVVGGSIRLNSGFFADGEVWFNGASIGRNFDCDTASFRNPDGYSLNLDSVRVAGGILMRNGCSFEGEVRLVAASVGSNFECDHSTFNNPSGISLNCDRLNVNGSIFFRRGFKSNGVTCLTSARVSASLVIREIGEPEKLYLDLRDANVGILSDDPTSWPSVGKLFLFGLTYESLADEATHDAIQRIDWLHRQPQDKFSSQPYEQLARIFHTEGNEDGAIQVMIAKNREREHHLGAEQWGSIPYILHWLNGKFIDYGYRPWKPLPLVIMLLLLGSVVFKIGWHLQLFAPTDRDAIVGKVNVPVRSYDPLYPKFSATMYSLSTFAPLVNLYVEDYWLPDANAVKEWHGRNWPLGAALRVYLWLHVITGWGLTTIVVAGFTGLIKT